MITSVMLLSQKRRHMQSCIHESVQAVFHVELFSVLHDLKCPYHYV